MKSAAELHALMRRILQSLHKIVAPSPGLAQALIKHGATRDRVIHLLYGISPEKIVCPTKEISESLRFGYVGGTDPIKGFATVADAIDLLPSGLPLKVRAYGGETLRQFVATRSTKVQSYIDWHPALFGQPLMEEHSKLDAMLVPSIVHENSPFAALESFANGTPVLGSDHPGISHLIVPGHNGWLIEPGNPAAWATAFIRAVEHPAHIRTMQLNTTFTRTTRDFVNDLAWVENRLLGRSNHREVFRPTPPVAIYA